ncbi:MAG TPA: sodium:solute symporter [Rudaea sp.]|jgi:SSS family solute:Na+ symporter|uniref:monocarboxylate uptake permease MctP n=1 Tax=Rudaea sp. TaxID=2136325 RepID=UPI002F9599DA
MSGEVHWTAWIVFAFFFALVTVIGFFASRWKAGDMSELHEWGLGGRRFGTWITWFLLGGDVYTAYTVVAVPALVFAIGAYGFFALPYTIIVYPLVFAMMPRLWNVCRKHNYVTTADFVEGRYGNHWLALAVALTGVLATMPYIALQLVGMQVVFEGMGFGGVKEGGEIALVVAFVILALYTYTSGLRAPAMIAFVKDTMIYIFVLAAIIIIPAQLGGYRAMFDAADKVFAAKGGATGIVLQPSQVVAFASLALGSAFALFLYPHTATGTLAASGPNVIRRNAIFLPAYTIALGLIAMLGYMALAAHVTAKGTAVVPALIMQSFPEWFAGFCCAAIALGALVPAAIMSIGAANLVTRNIWRPYVNSNMTPAQESNVAKITSLAVKFGALVFVVFLPLEFAINLQLLGGIWILQIFPAVILGLYTRWFSARGLLIGWAVGMLLGTWMSWSQGVKPVFLLPGIGTVYIGLIALAVNIVVAAIVTVVAGKGATADDTQPSDYEDAPGTAG